MGIKDEFESKIEVITTENMSLQKEIESMKAELSNVESFNLEIEALQAKIVELSSKPQIEAEEETEQSENQLTQLSAGLEHYKQACNDWNAWSETKVTEYNQLLEAYNQYVEAYDALQKSQLEKDEVIEEMKQKILSRDESSESHEKTIENLQSAFFRSRMQISRLREANEKKTDEL